MALEYILYADESIETGRYFSNFYGGCLVRSTDLREVTLELDARKQSLNLHGEIKWQKVTSNYVAKYEDLMSAFFDFVATGKIKVRVMFTQNRHIAAGLSQEQREDSYFLLYYQFIKHAFGLGLVQHGENGARVRIQLDRIPDTFERRAKFRGYLAALTKSPDFRARQLIVDPAQIAEVDSHDHVLLQCTDVVLGAMQFRLNDKHKEKRPGSTRRGRRTRAKEVLYKSILGHVRNLHPNFNPGISTGQRGDPTNRWADPYRHWLFIPSLHERDDSRTKPK